LGAVDGLDECERPLDNRVRHAAVVLAEFLGGESREREDARGTRAGEVRA
jgi:hypothetical protein